jgi:hypothetical protein
MIFSGYEHRIAAAFQAVDAEGTGVSDVTEDMNSSATGSTITIMANLVPNGDMNDDSNWTDVSAATGSRYDGTADADGIGGAHSGQYCWKISYASTDDGIISDTFSVTASQVYRVSVWVYPVNTTKTTITTIDGNGAAWYDTEHTVVANQWNHITFEDTAAETGSSATIQIDSGTDAAGTIYVDDVVIVKQNTYPELLIMTTRPAQAFKYYVSGANATNSTMLQEYWNGSAFTATTIVNGGSDGTTASSKTLAQTGTNNFDHTNGTVKFRHFEELYLYAYRITISAGEATVYHITADYGFQPVQNVWDGVYRQPIQFQVYDVDHYEDFTLQVNQSSDVNTPVGGVLDGITTTDHIIVMFEEQVSGMRWTMLGDLVNVAARTLTMYYWNGFEWTLQSYDDGTFNDAKTKTLNQTGLMSWTPNTAEKKQTLFNSVGYAYKLVPSGALTGAKGGAEEVVVDIISGIPALSDAVKPFDFSVLFKNRLMLGSFSDGAEGNRMDYCVSNAPDVWNGSQSSMDGVQSLYFGGVEKITCATQLYNRFGASVFSMLLVLKDTEVYLMVGDTPSTFIVYPVSQTTGCPAPNTLAVAEVGFEVGQGLSRNVAIWLSNSGPMMFDGAIISAVRGIENYFDPNETEYISWSAMSKARGWIDQTFKEYNLLIPSTSGQTTNNIWLVYDLIRRKWFQKDTVSAQFPQSGWSVMSPTTGEQSVYSGLDNGVMVEQETGTSWNATYADATAGSGIVQTCRTGDFFPSDNIWDEILIRKFKMICKKIPSTVTTVAHNLAINYYENAADSGANVIFQDSEASSGVSVDFEDMDVDGDGVYETAWTSSASAVLDLSLNVGLERIVRIINDMNASGWAHSFEFEVTTDDVPKGWQPIVWGIRYRIERKDETASATDE